MNTIRPLSRRQRGFTLVEIILVVAIIMTLVGLVGPRLADKAKRAKINATKIEINNIKTSLGLYEASVGNFPTTAQGLKALVEKPSDVDQSVWDKHMDALPRDSWGREFRYACPSDKKNKDYDLTSSGPDAKFDTPDDITNDPKDVDTGATTAASGDTAPK